MVNTELTSIHYHTDNITKTRPKQFYIFTNDFNKTIEIGNTKQNLPNNVYDAITLLLDRAKNAPNQILFFQNSSREFKKRLDNFYVEFKAYYSLINFIKTLQNIQLNHYFFFCPAIQFPVHYNLPHFVEKELCRLNNTSTEYFKIYKDIDRCYIHIPIYDQESNSKACKTGESIRVDRTCRFCNKKEPDVTFKNKSHAISEGLGNKILICNEECDECNKKFGQTIEYSLLTYLSIERSLLGVKGKNNKIPKIDLNYYRPQDCYRSMAKFFISLLPYDNLTIFYNTIKWITGSKAPHQLPLVWKTIVPQQFQKPFPKVSLFIQNDMNLIDDIPYALIDFCFGPYRYLCTIPFVPHDRKDYSQKEHFDKLWKVFHTYKAVKWKTLDWSSENKTKDQLNIRINAHPIK